RRALKTKPWVTAIGAGDRQHPLGEVDPEHVCRAVRGRVVCEATRTAAKVENPLAVKRFKQRRERGPFKRVAPARTEAVKLHIASKECGIVVDVLRVIATHN